jgi:hypothetical protein
MVIAVVTGIAEIPRVGLLGGNLNIRPSEYAETFDFKIKRTKGLTIPHKHRFRAATTASQKPAARD